MTKLTRKQRKEIYEKRQAGETYPQLSKEYKVRVETIYYLVRLIDRNGYEIINKKKNKYYPPELKQKIIEKVLIDHQS